MTGVNRGRYDTGGEDGLEMLNGRRREEDVRRIIPIKLVWAQKPAGSIIAESILKLRTRIGRERSVSLRHANVVENLC